MSDLSLIETHFNDRFARFKIHLPPADLAARRRGKIVKSGWAIWYLFGADEQGEYLDYYGAHRMAGNTHHRLRANGDRERLPTLQWVYTHSDDPVEAERLKAAFYAENQRIQELLEAKGFGMQGDEPMSVAVNHHLLTHPTP